MWTRLPWELWVSVASWLDLQNCFRLVRVCSGFKRKQGSEPLSPAELDLSRVERVHKLPPGFALTLGLARWKALRVLDLGTDPDTVAGLISELSLADLDQVRCIRHVPDGSGSSSDRREHVVVSNEHGYIRFAAVQIGPSFAVTWVLPKFSAIVPSQVESPSFRALGHDWRGVLYPRGNQTVPLTRQGSVSVYIENLTIPDVVPWSGLPWPLWQLVASWLDLAGCVRLATSSTVLCAAHKVSRLSPVELDLSRVERIQNGNGPGPAFLHALRIGQWTCLRILDLGTNPLSDWNVSIPRRVTQFRWIGPSVRAQVPDGFKPMEVELREPWAHGVVRLASVQWGPTFAVTWELASLQSLGSRLAREGLHQRHELRYGRVRVPLERDGREPAAVWAGVLALQLQDHGARAVVGGHACCSRVLHLHT